MSDFSQPEYASYVALCRELKLEREFQDGDLIWRKGEIADTGRWYELYSADIRRGSAFGSWLPTLSDWLEMLEGAGIETVMVNHEAIGGSWVGEQEYTMGESRVAYAPTREEAAARLWMAVTKPAVKC
jgi:hypothetical protein